MTCATANRTYRVACAAATRVCRRPDALTCGRRAVAQVRRGTRRNLRVMVADMTPTFVTSRSHPSLLLVGVWMVGGSLVVGGLTSVAQGLLPDSLRSVANSPSGWTLLTVVMISVARPRLLPAACFGAVSFVCLVLGYTFVSELRGLSYSPALWGAIGLLVGPVVGWATSAAFDGRSLLSVLGSSLIAGIAITDAVYGLTVIADTTSPVYWWIAAVAGVSFLVLVDVRRQPSRRYVAVQVVLTIGWTAVGSAGYAVLNGR
jgi:hypothetical protein